MRWLTLLFGSLLASCFGVTDDARGARCASPPDCPAPLACHAGYCVSLSDGGFADAGIDGILDGGARADASTQEPSADASAQGPAADASTPSAPASPRPRPPGQSPRPRPPPEQGPPTQAPPAQKPEQEAPPPPAPSEPEEPSPLEEPPARGDDDDDDDDEDDEDDEDDDDDDDGKHARACSEGCRDHELCQAGICCRWDRMACDGRCVNPWRDRNHCGACGNRCDDKCRNGRCTAENGRVCLDDFCIDLGGA